MGKDKKQNSIFSIDAIISKVWATSPHLVLIAAAWLIYAGIDTRLEKDYVSTQTYKAHVELMTATIKDVRSDMEEHNSIADDAVKTNIVLSTQVDILLRKAGLAP